MAEKDNRAAKAALGISAGAAIVSALAFLQKQAKAAPPGEGVTFEIPEELWNLVMAIALSGENIDADIKDLAQKLSDLAINVQGFPPNAESIASYRFECAVATQPYQLPDLAVPDGFPLHLLAWPFNPPGGLIFVGRSAAEASNPNQAYPMVPVATKDYFIQNASGLYVSATVVPAWIVVTAEQRRS